MRMCIRIFIYCMHDISIFGLGHESHPSVMQLSMYAK